MVFPPHFTRSASIGHRRTHASLGRVPRTTIDVADNRSMVTSLMVSRLNMNADYQSDDPINKSKQQVSTAFSNNSNQIRQGSDQATAQNRVNRKPLLRKR
jgi:hypothetical protein